MPRAALLKAMLAIALCLALTAPARAGQHDASSVYATALRAINPHLALEQSLAYARTLLENARRWRLDPALIMAVVKIESNWDPSAVSYAGAQGLGQLEPGTARSLGVSDPTSGRDNLRGSILYLHQLLDSFHKMKDPVRSALAGYNVGPYAVARNGGIPPTAGSERYVGKVLRAWSEIKASVALIKPPPEPASRARRIVPVSVAPVNVATVVEQRDETYWGSK